MEFCKCVRKCDILRCNFSGLVLESFVLIFASFKQHLFALNAIYRNRPRQSTFTAKNYIKNILHQRKRDEPST